MHPKLTDNFDITLTWDNMRDAHFLPRTPDISVLTFKPCSVSEFELHGELHLAAVMNYQGPTRITFETCVYAFELQWFAQKLRAHVRGEMVEDLMIGATDFELKARHIPDIPNELPELSQKAQTIVELQYEPFRCDPMRSLTSQLRVHLGPMADPLGTARIIEDVLRTLEMDCAVNPEHGPLKFSR
jgi:hypothetical protein